MIYLEAVIMIVMTKTNPECQAHISVSCYEYGFSGAACISCIRHYKAKYGVYPSGWTNMTQAQLAKAGIE